MLDVPQLETSVEGVVLRLLTDTDTQSYFEVIDRNRDHLSRFGDYQEEKTATLAWVQRHLANAPEDNLRLGIWCDSALIGRADLNMPQPRKFVIGYWLDSEFTGKGYATACCRTIIDYARSSLGATDIFAGVTHGNAKSIAVLKRLGFDQVMEFETYSRFHLPLGESSD